MPRTTAVMIAAAASILLVFASAVLAVNAGLFGTSTDNVGKLTPAAATGPAAPTTITVQLDPAVTAPATPAAAVDTDASKGTDDARTGEPAKHEHEEGDDD